MAYLKHQYCSVTPGIFKVNEVEKEIVIHAKQKQVRKWFENVLKVQVWFVDSRVVPGSPEDGAPFTRNENGDLVVRIKTPREGEYAVSVEFQKNEHAVGTLEFPFYAVKENLFNLKPFKGDFHMHSTRSDGSQEPEYVAATCRKMGFDFMSLTDHRKYAPSLEAKNFMAEMDCDMLVVPGEEVHLPDNPVHIINFGANASINELAYNNEEKYRAEVAEYMKSLTDDVDETTKFQVAASEWTFDRIRENGGISMFCHPYWKPRNHNSINYDVIESLMDHNRFDVLEVFGGYPERDAECNMLALSRWQEERAKGKKIPVAGISDSHNCDVELAGWYYTIVFAQDLDFKSIAEAIRDDRSTAVHWIPGHAPIVAGSFRLTKFVYFLLREFYPAHDELCSVEGEAIIRHIRGEEADIKAFIAARKGAVERFMKEYWE